MQLGHQEWGLFLRTDAKDSSQLPGEWWVSQEKSKSAKASEARAVHKELATTYLRPSGACSDAHITEGGRGQASFASQCGWRLSGPTCESAPSAGVGGLPP